MNSSDEDHRMTVQVITEVGTFLDNDRFTRMVNVTLVNGG